jgi:protein TonB
MTLIPRLSVLLSIILILATTGLAQTPPAPPPPPAPLQVPKDAITVSGGMLQASGIKKAEPVYPPIARVARVEGEVRIQVIVSEEGKVIAAAIIDGHPLLRDAALQAARQWEFPPKEISGKLIKVVGVLTFHFMLK